MTANKCLKSVAMFKDLELAVTNQNPLPEEIKSTLNSGNTCYLFCSETFVFLYLL